MFVLWPVGSPGPAQRCPTIPTQLSSHFEPWGHPPTRYAMAFGSSNLNILGHYWWQLCQMFQNNLILLKPLISWARGRLSKDDVCAVQTPGSPEPWLLTSRFVSVFSSLFILLHSSWEGGLWLQGLLDCPSTCRTKPCVISADLMHPAATGVSACLTDAQRRAATPHLPTQTAQPAACPVGPSILVKSMKALNKTSRTNLLLWQMHPPGRVSSDTSGEKEQGIWQLLICLLFWQPQLAWSHCPQDQSPHCTWPLPRNCCPPRSSLPTSCWDCSPVQAFNTAQAHTPSKMAPGGPVGSPDSGPACLPKRKKGSWVLV